MDDLVEDRGISIGNAYGNYLSLVLSHGYVA